MTKFCCKYMNSSILDPRTAIKYGPIFREYYLKGEEGMMIDYCPWCSRKLPISLRETFFEVLEDEYKIETDIGECFEKENLPPEFRTDEWWKKRNL